MTARSPQSAYRFLIGAAALLLFSLCACRLTTTGQPLTTQTSAPLLLLESTAGQLNSQTALASGPLVLVFYRGHW